MNNTVLSLSVFVATVCLIQNAVALPRDSGLKTEEINNYYEPLNKVFSTEGTLYPAPYRVYCEYEEPTEDLVCQEHCLSRGYSYGICVSKTCSCV